nr:MAG TPA: hypothetical protein [Caudoviricetes sp.]
MEIVKNVAAILGAILSLSAVVTLCCKPIKAWLAQYLERYKKERDEDARENQLQETLVRLETAMNEIKVANDITVDYTREQIRGTIKGMFYEYYDNKVLPLYEHKWLLKLEDLYIRRLNGNSFAAELIAEMKKWPVDYSKVREGEDL